MVYTEVKKRNANEYFYRVLSVRKGKAISKMRKYLGVNLSKKELSVKEKEADKEINSSIKDKRKTELDRLKAKITGILLKNKIKRAGIFGSYATGSNKKHSDIDLLIEPPKGMGFEFVGLQIKLETALNKKIDLVSYNGLSPYLKERILSEEVRII